MRLLRIGIVGLHFGRVIIERIRSDAGNRYFEVAAVCANTAAKVDEAAIEFGVKGIVGLDNLLLEPDIPVIGLFTGPEGRARLIRKIIRAGKDVITTKPFEMNVDDAWDVLQEARKLGRMIYVNSPSSLPSSDLQQIMRWQDEYGLGQPIAARADTWISYREHADGSWYDDPIRCPVAPIFRLGIYPLYDILRLMDNVEQVSAISSRLFTGRPTPDHALLSLKFHSGAIASVFASFCIDDGQRVKHTLILNFEKGTIYRNIPDIRNASNEMTELSLIARDDSGCAITLRKSFLDKSGDYQWKHIYNHITGKQLMECPADIIIEGLRVTKAMEIANQQGSWQFINREEVYV